MGIVFDATVLIDFERGRIDLAQRISGREREAFFLSVISASELLHGVFRAATVEARSKRAAFVESVLSGFPLLTIDLATARIHAQLWADLASRGKIIGAHDLWIGATCIAHGHVLATANLRDFERIPGLQVERW